MGEKNNDLVFVKAIFHYMPSEYKGAKMITMHDGDTIVETRQFKTESKKLRTLRVIFYDQLRRVALQVLPGLWIFPPTREAIDNALTAMNKVASKAKEEDVNIKIIFSDISLPKSLILNVVDKNIAMIQGEINMIQKRIQKLKDEEKNINKTISNSDKKNNDLAKISALIRKLTNDKYLLKAELKVNLSLKKYLEPQSNNPGNKAKDVQHNKKRNPLPLEQKEEEKDNDDNSNNKISIDI